MDELGKPVHYVPMYYCDWLDSLRRVLELVVDDLDELPYWGA